MNCKYCHLNTHLIDKCPTIICKICKEVGHPQWLCKDKKINKQNNIYEIKKKIPVDNLKKKNISYYLKLNNTQWSDL
jgi:hypothetical protein